MGSYHVNIYVGSPPQRRLVIIDTGSRFLVFPCKPCRKCGNTHFSKQYFDPSFSTTDIKNQCNEHENEQCFFKKNNGGYSGTCEDFDEKSCPFYQAYTEGSSIKGFEVEDLVWFGTDNFEQSIKVHMQTAIPFSFGCETHEKGIIASQYADGIMGMTSLWHDTAVDVMYREGVIPHRAFSLCFTPQGGTLSLGGTALSHLHSEQMATEPITSSTFYSVEVIACMVGDVELKGGSENFIANAFNAGKGTLIDSGTTDTYITHIIEPAFVKAWEDITSSRYHNKRQKLTWSQFKILPDITIVLSSGYKWVIEPHSYMEQILVKGGPPFVDTRSTWNGNVIFVNRLYVDEPEGTVLGSNAMIGYDILFDIDKHTFGIAKSKCTSE
eukprot:scaffold2192_cov268-Chaetoceros_neogracile.AAC.97